MRALGSDVGSDEGVVEVAVGSEAEVEGALVTSESPSGRGTVSTRRRWSVSSRTGLRVVETTHQSSQE